jgi:hypothetical protein
MPFPVSEKFIEQAESELGAKFPESLRRKMMRSNGGEVEASDDCFELHPFYDTSDLKRIKRTCNSIVHETKKARRYYRLPFNLVQIGANGCGDLLVFKVLSNGKMDSSVYWFNHESEELAYVACDFAKLV